MPAPAAASCGRPERGRHLPERIRFRTDPPAGCKKTLLSCVPPLRA